MGNIAIVATFLPKEGEGKHLADAIRDVMHMSRQEEGCLRYDVFLTQEEPVRHVLIEVYRDSAAVSEHRQAEHYKEFRKRVINLLQEPNNVLVLESAPQEGGATPGGA